MKAKTLQSSEQIKNEGSTGVILMKHVDETWQKKIQERMQIIYLSFFIGNQVIVNGCPCSFQKEKSIQEVHYLKRIQRVLHRKIAIPKSKLLFSKA